MLIDFWLQKRPMLAPQNDQKTIKKTTRKKNQKKIEKRANIDPKKSLHAGPSPGNLTQL